MGGRFDRNGWPISAKPVAALSEIRNATVRADVRLINAVDEALARRGELVPDRIRSYDASGLVERGEVGTVIPAHVLEELGLGIRGQRVVSIPTGDRMS